MCIIKHLIRTAFNHHFPQSFIRNPTHPTTLGKTAYLTLAANHLYQSHLTQTISQESHGNPQPKNPSHVCPIIFPHMSSHLQCLPPIHQSDCPLHQTKGGSNATNTPTYAPQPIPDQLLRSFHQGMDQGTEIFIRKDRDARQRLGT